MAKKNETDEQEGFPKVGADIPMPPVKPPKKTTTAKTPDEEQSNTAPPADQGEQSWPGGQILTEVIFDRQTLVIARSGDRAVEEQVIRINRAFRAQGFDALVLVVPDDTKVELLDEQQMNGAGWYRRDSE